MNQNQHRRPATASDTANTDARATSAQASSDASPRSGLSVWPTGQRAPHSQRGDRYIRDTISHPARMLPAVAAYAIEHLTSPGELVLDPMCGAGTTLIEALHLGRVAVGVELEPRWAALSRANIAHNRRHGVGGHAHVITADARMLPDVLPPDYAEQMRGQVSLVLTSPPYGAHTHGQVETRPGQGVRKTDFRYTRRARAANLAHQPLHRLLGGMTRILRGCIPLLAPGGYVAITARPWRDHGELVDLPGAVTAAAIAAGLTPVQRCVALLAGIRHPHTAPGADTGFGAELVTRASFFQRAAVAKARAAGLPWALISHEDVLLFCKPTVARAARRTNPPPLGTPPPAIDESAPGFLAA